MRQLAEGGRQLQHVAPNGSLHTRVIGQEARVLTDIIGCRLWGTGKRIRCVTAAKTCCSLGRPSRDAKRASMLTIKPSFRSHTHALKTLKWVVPVKGSLCCSLGESHAMAKTGVNRASELWYARVSTILLAVEQQKNTSL